MWPGCRLAVDGEKQKAKSNPAQFQSAVPPHSLEMGGVGAVEVAATQRGFQAEMGQNGRKRLATGQHMPKMALKGPFDPPQGSGTTFEKIPFCTFFGPIWPGCRLAVDGSLAVVGWGLVVVGG